IYLDGQLLAITTVRSGSGGGTTTETLFSDDFSGNDGDIIDDQPDKQWRGKRPRSTTISATIQSNQAKIVADQRLSTEATFIDEVDTRLTIELDLIGPGKTTLKKVKTPKTGIRVRFKPSKIKGVRALKILNLRFIRHPVGLSHPAYG
ncbi:MAG: hypothetical protein MI865_08960, partial [Proteobacteria bacterium]|nr:hypothetical protein [Pseudomonadota bacterium]